MATISPKIEEKKGHSLIVNAAIVFKWFILINVLFKKSINCFNKLSLFMIDSR